MLKPVILLAFANEYDNQRLYLRHLEEEMNGLTKVLEKAEDQGLCEVVVLANTTLEKLVGVFQRAKYRNRIAIFHYSGHADSYALLLQEKFGKTINVHGDGLIPFLSNQSSLQFIFLNGCYSSQQAEDLTKAGVNIVIGTVSAVRDDVASVLAISFYRALGEGASLEQSWKEAIFQQKARKGTKDFNEYYIAPTSSETTHRGMGRSQKMIPRFPWNIYYKEGAEESKHWNLPAAANNFLSVLPAPSVYDLPDQPYRFLARFKKTDVAIFFGRSRSIWELYRCINDDKLAPVILFYGQSGAGKSSMLAAGLVPRLIQNSEVKYIRRTSENGLLADFKIAFNFEGDFKKGEGVVVNNDWKKLEKLLPELSDRLQLEMQQLINSLKEKEHLLEKESFIPPTNLLQVWKQIEKIAGRPLHVIIDQLEEVFTRSREEEKQELELFLKTISILFRNSNERPQGKLILGFRKEFLPEIDQLCSQYQIPREKLFLKKLNKSEIIEVVNGLTLTVQLQKHYQLKVEEGLPEMIADDLQEDPDSTIAPILQILLTKLWRMTEHQEERAFTIANYQQLRRAGILMNDFFNQQMEALSKWNQDLEKSGLALDLLYRHTTDLGTATNQSLSELRERYQHREEAIDQLISKCKELYLLSSTSADRTSLIHDTMSPIVRQQTKNSDRIGQRALRILETKMQEYDRQPEDTIIDEADLKLVEHGANGMRLWMPKEKELIEKSRAVRRKNRMLRMFGYGLLGMLLILGGLFLQQKNSLKKKQQLSRMYNNALLLEANGRPTAAMQIIRKAVDIDPNERASLQLQHQLYSNNEFFKDSFSFSNEIIAVEWSSDDYKLWAAAAGKTIFIKDRKGTVVQELMHPTELGAFAFLPSSFNDNSYLVTGSQDGLIRKWNTKTKAVEVFKKHHSDWINAIDISDDGQWTLSGDRNGVAILWNNKGEKKLIYSNENNEITSVAISPNGDHLLIGRTNGSLQMIDPNGNFLQDFIGHKDRILALDFSPDGQYILSGSRDATARVWDLKGNISGPYLIHQKRINQVQWSADGRFLLTASDDKTIKLWSNKGQLFKTYKGHSSFVNTAVLSKDSRFILSGGADRTVKYWTRDSKVKYQFENIGAECAAIGISSNGDYLLAGQGNGERLLGETINDLSFEEFLDKTIDFHDSHTATLFNLRTGLPIKKLQIPHGGINSIIVENEQLITAGDDGMIRFWAMDGSLKDTILLENSSINCMAKSNNNQNILVGTKEKKAFLLDSSNKIQLSLEEPNTITAVDIHPSTHQLLTANFDGKIRLYDNSTIANITIEAHQGKVGAACFSPNGQYILSGGADNISKLWTRDGKLLLELPIEETNKTGGQGISAVCFSSDSQYIIIGSEGAIVKVYNLEGQEIQTIRDFYGAGVFAIAAAKDGLSFYVGSGDGTIRGYEILR